MNPVLFELFYAILSLKGAVEATDYSCLRYLNYALPCSYALLLVLRAPNRTITHRLYYGIYLSLKTPKT